MIELTSQNRPSLVPPKAEVVSSNLAGCAILLDRDRGNTAKDLVVVVPGTLFESPTEER